MLARITAFFSASMEVDSGNSPTAQRRTIEIATAALLIEVSRSDFDLSATEKQAVIGVLKKQFKLSKCDVGTLIELAESEVENSVSLFQFTQLVNESYDYPQKLKLIQAMWQIAYADGDLDKYEDYLIRKVADLTYVSHSDFIKQKLRVAEGSER